jgi:predicted nucleic acid-binding protein
MAHLTHTEMKVIDSNVWISFISPNDSTHNLAIKLFEEYYTTEILLYDFVYAEVLTVLRNKNSDEGISLFLKLLEDWSISIHSLTSTTIQAATKFFLHFPNLSFPDALALTMSIQNKHELITFDKALQKAWLQVKK